MDKNRSAFFALVRAGLWGTEARLAHYGSIGWSRVYKLASEQSLLGLVLAGLERADVKPPQAILLQWIGEVQMLEQRNRAMNEFVEGLFKKMQSAGIEAILVKGQGVAQCYERPFWRASGDVDLLFDAKNYESAKDVLVPMGKITEDEDLKKRHQALSIQGFIVELHGRMPFAMSGKADRVIEEAVEIANTNHFVFADVLEGVSVPKPDEHIFIVFTHFLHHFFLEGVGLRQICDWCRMLWKYRETLNYSLLESRIIRSGLMSEWRGFAELAVSALGMPVEAMPFYEKGYERRAGHVLRYVMKNGNFGRNKDVSYRGKYSSFVSNLITFFRRMRDFMKFSIIFPWDSPRFFLTYVIGKV